MLTHYLAPRLNAGLLSFIFFLTASSAVIGQRYEDFTFEVGVAAVGTRSQILDIYPILVDESIYQPTPYDILEVDAIGGELFFRAGAPESGFFTEGSLTITSNVITLDSLSGGHFHLENDRGLKYSMLFDYDRAAIGLKVGYFVVGSSYGGFALAPLLGINWGISGGSRVFYKSTEEEFDLGVQQALRDALKIRNDFTVMVGTNFQYKFENSRIAIEIGYSYEWGQSDMIETLANPFFWREIPTNYTRAHRVRLGVLVDLYE